MRDLISVLKLFDTETMNPDTVDITRTDSNFTFWTRTLWNDQDAMRVFMLSGAHRRMMPRLLNWCDEASVAHWAQDSLETPSWQEVHGRMQAQGRRSKVNHPSEVQQRFEIPVPRTTTELKLK